MTGGGGGAGGQCESSGPSVDEAGVQEQLTAWLLDLSTWRRLHLGNRTLLAQDPGLHYQQGPQWRLPQLSHKCTPT